VKNKQEGGFSLIEVVLAMVILALIVVPTCTSLVLSFRVNAKADAMLQAQLAVSSAVEQLMAEGIIDQKAEEAIAYQEGVYDIIPANGDMPETDEFPDVKIAVEQSENCYKVVVTDNNDLVTVTTYIRGGGTQ
jgi:prepilin-type N-terminal cleavage/methylation domain-containing protein